MRFKTPRIQNEFEQLKDKNQHLKLMLLAIDNFTLHSFGKDVCITDLFRFSEDLKRIYTSSPNPPKDSPHCHWFAADLRSFDFSEDQIVKILEFCNQFNFNGKKVALYHKISGNVFHLHIQFK